MDYGYKEWAESYATAHSENLTKIKVSTLESKLENYTQQIATLTAEAEQEDQAAADKVRGKQTFSILSATAATTATFTQINTHTIVDAEVGTSFRATARAAISTLTATAASASASMALGARCDGKNL